MEIIQTEIQKQLTTLTNWEVLREINKRDGLLSEKSWQEEFARLDKGVMGEQSVLSFLRKCDEPHWKVLQNVWLDYYGEFEIDLMVLTRVGIYTFEVKNYSGKLEYENHQCKLNSQPIGQNPFSQTQKVATQLRNILGGPIKNVLLFIGESNTVQVRDEITGIQVLMRNELQNYIWQMVQEERNYLGYPLDINDMLHALRHHEIGRPSKEKILPTYLKQHLRKGICCSHCRNFEVEMRKGYIICACGMYEPREEAIVRTICEYGVIFSDRNLRTAEISEFFGDVVSLSTVRRILIQHFEQVDGKKRRVFLNKRLPFEKVRYEFDLSASKFMRLI